MRAAYRRSSCQLFQHGTVVARASPARACVDHALEDAASSAGREKRTWCGVGADALVFSAGRWGDGVCGCWERDREFRFGVG